jgi:hypothetical protein
MKYGICPFSVVSLRVSAVDTSEMCTQLLFGEMTEVLEKKGRSWIKVRCQNDNTIAWMHSDQLQPVTAEEFERYNKEFAYCLDLMQPIVATDHFLPITLGARLPLFDGLKCQFGDRSYQFSGQAVDPQQLLPNAALLEKLARRYLYAPYLHGGRSPLGIDSAGLIQLLFQMVRISLPRRAAQQIHYGEPVDFVDQSLPGDLAFFENRVGRITHVGMVLEDAQVLHVGDCVRVDRLDHYGIFNETRQHYTHKLRVLRRLLPVTKVQREKPRVVPTVQKEQMQLFERSFLAE